MFDVAVYTDVPPDQAPNGVGGFRIQARSRGVTSTDEDVVYDRLAHRIWETWAAERDPLDHPPSFVCMSANARTYIARGRSTGMTWNKRPGNSVTQAIMTSDPADLASYRPAQMLGAVRWNLRSSPEGVLEPWAAPLEIAEEFEAAALCDMVREDPWASSVLPVFLTLVERAATRADPCRLVIVHPDPVMAMRWVALGSLFIEPARALELTIRGMVPSPLETDGDIVATSPDFGPRISSLVGEGGIGVIDLDQHLVSDMVPSASARVQADWFIHRPADDALNAIDLARRWEASLGADLATRAAGLVILPGQARRDEDWATVVNSVRGLAAAGAVDDLFLYGGDLLEVASVHEPSSVSDVERVSEASVEALRVGAGEVARGLLMPTISTMAERAELIPAWARTFLDLWTPGAPVVWENEEDAHDIARGIQALLAVCEDQDLPLLLSLVPVLSPGLGADRAPGAVVRMGSTWARHPDLTPCAPSWAWTGDIRVALAGALCPLWEVGDPTSLDNLMGGTWDWLGEGAVPTWVRAARIGRTEAAHRPELLKREGAALPPTSWRIVWAGLDTMPDAVAAVVVQSWVEAQRDLDPLAARVWAKRCRTILGREAEASFLRPGLESVSRIRSVDTDGRGGLRDLSRRVQDLHVRFSRALHDWEVVPNTYLAELSAGMDGLAPVVADDLALVAVTAFADSAGAQRVLDAAPVPSARGVWTLLHRQGDEPRGWATAVPLALQLLETREGPVTSVARDFLLEVVDKPRRALGRAVEMMDPYWARSFTSFAEEEHSGKAVRVVRRAIGGGLPWRKEKDHG